MSLSAAEFFSDMQNCFTPKEWSVIYRGQSDVERSKRFFLFWCLKESYIKAVGIGLGFELQRAEFTLDAEQNPSSATLMIDKVSRPDWVFELHFHDVRPALATVSPSFLTAQLRTTLWALRMDHCSMLLQDTFLQRSPIFGPISGSVRKSQRRQKYLESPSRS